MPGDTRSSEKVRCSWAERDPMLIDYHDTEWGRFPEGDRGFFESLCLESLQAGLSWRTVLAKRSAYREHFCHFEPLKVASLSDAHLETCAQSPALIRHKGKTFALRHNARVFCEIQKECRTFGHYVQRFISCWEIENGCLSLKTFNQTFVSQELAQDLRKRGMVFVGSVTVHAFMQATGLIEAHEQRCFLKTVKRNGCSRSS